MDAAAKVFADFIQNQLQENTQKNPKINEFSKNATCRFCKKLLKKKSSEHCLCCNVQFCSKKCLLKDTLHTQLCKLLVPLNSKQKTFINKYFLVEAKSNLNVFFFQMNHLLNIRNYCQLVTTYVNAKISYENWKQCFWANINANLKKSDLLNMNNNIAELPTTESIKWYRVVLNLLSLAAQKCHYESQEDSEYFESCCMHNIPCICAINVKRGFLEAILIQSRIRLCCHASKKIKDLNDPMCFVELSREKICSKKSRVVLSSFETNLKLLPNVDAYVLSGHCDEILRLRSFNMIMFNNNFKRRIFQCMSISNRTSYIGEQSSMISIIYYRKYLKFCLPTQNQIFDPSHIIREHMALYESSKVWQIVQSPLKEMFSTKIECQHNSKCTFISEVLEFFQEKIEDCKTYEEINRIFSKQEVARQVKLVRSWYKTQQKEEKCKSLLLLVMMKCSNIYNFDFTKTKIQLVQKPKQISLIGVFEYTSTTTNIYCNSTNILFLFENSKNNYFPWLIIQEASSKKLVLLRIRFRLKTSVRRLYIRPNIRYKLSGKTILWKPNRNVVKFDNFSLDSFGIVEPCLNFDLPF